MGKTHWTPNEPPVDVRECAEAVVLDLENPPAGSSNGSRNADQRRQADTGTAIGWSPLPFRGVERTLPRFQSACVFGIHGQRLVQRGDRVVIRIVDKGAFRVTNESIRRRRGIGQQGLVARESAPEEKAKGGPDTTNHDSLHPPLTWSCFIASATYRARGSSGHRREKSGSSPSNSWTSQPALTRLSSRSSQCWMRPSFVKRHTSTPGFGCRLAASGAFGLYQSSPRIGGGSYYESLHRLGCRRRLGRAVPDCQRNSESEHRLPALRDGDARRNRMRRTWRREPNRSRSALSRRLGMRRTRGSANAIHK